MKRRVLAKVDCPRCNAPAELRPEAGESNLFIIYLTCKYCKLKKSVGVSTWEVYRNEVLIAKLKVLLDKADDKMVQATLRGKIKRLEEANKKKELGI